MDGGIWMRRDGMGCGMVRGRGEACCDGCGRGRECGVLGVGKNDGI